MIRKIKLARLKKILLILLSISLIVFLVLYALSKNINLYFSIAEINSGNVPLQKNIRIGGMIQPGSIIKSSNMDVVFSITDYNNSVKVKYNGILPDLFKEQQGVVVLGKLINKQEFVAEQVLAKHDEKYMPREIAELQAKNSK